MKGLKAKEGEVRSRGQSGFSLMELMVVVAIMAILASVAIPAYINYVNRARQGDAMTCLMNARLDQEAFWEEQGTRYSYASTIGCLPSLVSSANTNCLSNCSGCAQTAATCGNYSISIEAGANSNYYAIRAQRVIFGRTDIVRISSTLSSPMVVNENAIKLSILNLIFK